MVIALLLLEDKTRVRRSPANEANDVCMEGR